MGKHGYMDGLRGSSEQGILIVKGATYIWKQVLGEDFWRSKKQASAFIEEDFAAALGVWLL